VTRRLPVAIHLGCRADHRGDLGLSAISVSILFAAGLLAVCLLCASVCLAAELCRPRAGTAVAQHQSQLATHIEARLKTKHGQSYRCLNCQSACIHML